MWPIEQRLRSIIVHHGLNRMRVIRGVLQAPDGPRTTYEGWRFNLGEFYKMEANSISFLLEVVLQLVLSQVA